MIKVVRRFTESKKFAVKFECFCGCEFWADQDSILNEKTKNVSHYTMRQAVCPDCGKEVCSIKMPIDRELVFNA